MRGKPIGLDALLQFWALYFGGDKEGAEYIRDEAQEAFRRLSQPILQPEEK